MFTLLALVSFPLLAHALPSAPLHNPGLKITVPITCGASQTFSDVLVDTGSCLLWVGGEGVTYSPGPNSVATGQSFSAGYGAGYAAGTVYFDTVIAGSAKTTHLVLGAANTSNFPPPAGPVEGIFGLGQNGCDFNQVEGNYTTPTFLQTLVAEGTISNELFGLHVPPYQGTGEVTFGWLDSSKYSGELVWLPLEPDSSRFIVNITGARYGSTVVQSAPYAVYTDSGNLYLGMESNAFFSMVDLIPGASVFSDNFGPLLGTMTFPSNTSIASLQPITYTFSNGSASVDIAIPPESYIIPTSLYSAMNATGDYIFTWLTPGNLGQKFLENAYSGYDLDEQKIGFASLA